MGILIDSYFEGGLWRYLSKFQPLLRVRIILERLILALYLIA